jgi:hypothetical protein
MKPTPLIPPKRTVTVRTTPAAAKDGEAAE